MTENISEYRRAGYIPLFSTNEGVDLTQSTFSSKPRELLDVGIVQLFGSRELSTTFDDGEMGVTIVDGQLIIDTANNLANRGLFHIDVIVMGVKPGTINLDCRMILPSVGIVLNSEVFSGEDEVNKHRLIERYFGSTEEWFLPDSKGPFHFFALGDANFLNSQMLFTLRFSLIARR